MSNICYVFPLLVMYMFLKQVTSSELTNGVINTAFLMLYKVKLCIRHNGMQFQEWYGITLSAPTIWCAVDFVMQSVCKRAALVRQ